MKKILVTCPPMLNQIHHFENRFGELGYEVTLPKVSQTLSVNQLLELVPEHDGWIIGDDPATREVFSAGKRGKLKAAVKWGVGVDNVDFLACDELGIKIVNTPDMFGDEVSDVAVCYVIGLARGLFQIHESVKGGGWLKISGVSLQGKSVGVIGLGSIGATLSKKLNMLGMKVYGYDPYYSSNIDSCVEELLAWPAKLNQLDFLIFTCALNSTTKHLLNLQAIKLLKPGVMVVNVSRGGIVDELALIEGLSRGIIHSAALDVFEVEPMPILSPLRQLNCIFGSHNASNTVEAVIKTSNLAIDKLATFLGRPSV
jgi:D-3-phosphoglycerate dehydrogenase / 2-oxoglutarate reductase